MDLKFVLFGFYLMLAQFPNESLCAKFANLSEAIKNGETLIEKLYKQYDMPSLAFGLSIKGKTVYSHVKGFADLENNVPAKLTTKYQLASISKTFTSTLLATLVDQGLVHYNDPIEKYLKPAGFPVKTWAGKPVNLTVSQVLSHTAGLRTSQLNDYDNLHNYPNLTIAISKFMNDPLIYAPGTEWQYANYDFVVIGAIIEAVTKKSYLISMTEFFSKHGLNSSYVETPELLIKDRARGYRSLNLKGIQLKENLPALIMDHLLYGEGEYAPGGLMSTVGDLLHYGNLLIDSFKGRPKAMLSQKTIKEMWTSRTSNINKGKTHIDYGYGWAILNINQTEHPDIKHRHIVWHNGGLTGTSTMLYVYPEEEIVGVAFSNKGFVQPGLDPMIIKMVENVYDFV